MAQDGRERRSHFRGKPRPGRRVEVSFLVATPADATEPSEPRRAFTRNIGVGGAFVVTEAPPRPGTPLTVFIHVPGTDAPIEVRGEVRWSSASGAPGMGVKFADLAVEDLLSLNDYFASLGGGED
jgi:uncharacterized protein (TIGR02266 family)